MTRDDRFLFLLTSLLALAICLGAWQVRERKPAGLPDRPALGRSLDEVTAGPDPAFPRLGASARLAQAAEAQQREFSRIAAALPGGTFPGFTERLIFHPIADRVLPGGDLEEGPPYQVAIAADGSWTLTERGRRSAAAAPPGLPQKIAPRSFHVAVLDADHPSVARDATVRTWWLFAASRSKLGRDKILFADEVAGSTIVAPHGFDRAGCVPDQASLAEVVK